MKIVISILAAEKLCRHWIRIDISFLVINLVKSILKNSFPNCEFAVEGEPKDVGSAIELAKPPFQFQWWVLSVLGASPVGSKKENPRVGKKGAKRAHSLIECLQDQGLRIFLTLRELDTIYGLTLLIWYLKYFPAFIYNVTERHIYKNPSNKLMLKVFKSSRERPHIYAVRGK